MPTRSTTVIAAPPADVFAVIADVERYPEWIDQLKAVEVLDRDGEGRASRARFVVDAGVFADTVVLDHEWGADRADWRLVEGGKVRRQDGTYLLRAVDGGTEVTYELGLDVDMPMFGLFRGQAERAIVDGGLRALKGRVERGA